MKESSGPELLVTLEQRKPRYMTPVHHRILRALRRGMRDPHGPCPYTNRSAGKLLTEAFTRGQVMALGIVEMTTNRAPIDLSEEFQTVIWQLESTLPAAWPRESQA